VTVLAAAQAACRQVVQVQSRQTQFAQLSSQCSHSHALCTQVGQLQSVQTHAAQKPSQFGHLHAVQVA
jgi:hypothetical protein